MSARKISAARVILDPIYSVILFLVFVIATVTHLDFVFAFFFVLLSQKNRNDAPEPTATSRQNHCEFLRDPDDLPCAACTRLFTAAPQVIQTKVCLSCLLFFLFFGSKKN